jgi:hypothetical protein
MIQSVLIRYYTLLAVLNSVDSMELPYHVLAEASQYFVFPEKLSFSSPAL